MPKQTKTEKLIDARVERAYYSKCTGVQINIMDIGKVFNVGRGFIVAEPAITDAALADKVAAFVQTIRQDSRP